MTHSVPVKSIATQKLFTIASGTSLQEARQLMEEKRIRHLPVVDEFNCIIGVLSKHDIKIGLEAQSLAVDYFMNSPVESVFEEAPLRPAIFKMLEKKISCLLIEDENQEAVGIVTTDDLLWHLAFVLKDESYEKSTWLKPNSMKSTIGELAQKFSFAGI